MEPFVGQIMLTALAYAPQGWVFCDGAKLSISEDDNQALFALINNMYGGDGYTTFCVPDLRGAIPIGMNYSAAPFYQLGAKGGSATYMPSPLGTTANSGSTSLTYAAGEIPQANLPPFIGLSYIICVLGLYPVRPD